MKSTDTDQDKKAATQTFTGCLMGEPEYRRAHNLGSGALGGAGLGDEFVLVDVKVSPAKASETSSMNGATKDRDDATKRMNSDSSAAAPPSASACADKGVAYRLTGDLENKLSKSLVGHQLEVQGRFKHPEQVAEAGTASGDKLPPEVTIVSYTESPAPAAMSAPAAPVTPPSTTTPPPQPTMTQPQPPPPPPQTTQPPPPPPTQPQEQPRELPHSASSQPLLALIGLLALGSGVALTVLRRRSL